MILNCVNAWLFGAGGGGVSNITFVGSKTFQHTSGTNQTVSLTDLKDESNNNATLQENDVVVVSIERSAVSNLGGVYPQPPSTGYVAVGGDIYVNSTYDTNLGIAYKIMGETPDTDVTIPLTGSGGCAVIIFVLRGIDTSSPLDVTETVATGTNSNNVNAPAITPTTAGAWISVIGGWAGFTTGNISPAPSDLSATTNHFKSVTSNGSTMDSGCGFGLKTDWTNGSFDPVAWSGGGSNDYTWAGCTIAWRPTS